MPKSRKRAKPSPKSGEVGGRSGNPARRAAQADLAALVDPRERAASRVAHAVAFTDTADPLQVISIPPLYLDVIVAANAHLLPAGRCVDDCTTLAHAYAQLGIPAQVRAAELRISSHVTK